jgi:hypothetical protein
MPGRRTGTRRRDRRPTWPVRTPDNRRIPPSSSPTPSRRGTAEGEPWPSRGPRSSAHGRRRLPRQPLAAADAVFVPTWDYGPTSSSRPRATLRGASDTARSACTFTGLRQPPVPALSRMCAHRQALRHCQCPNRADPRQGHSCKHREGCNCPSDLLESPRLKNGVSDGSCRV